MKCPECGKVNVPGSLFCEACGAELDAAPAEPEVHAAEAGASAVPCPDCGHLNDPDFAVCEACGRRLKEDSAPPEPEAAPEPAPETEPEAEAPPAPEAPRRRLETEFARKPAPPDSEPAPQSRTANTPGQLVTGPQQGQVKLVVEQGLVVGKQFILNEDRMLVGREDAGESIYPEIDLSGLDEGYVHRQHARLTFEGSFLFVTHLGGHNRTYVNNRPIADHLAHPLNIGDTVRFGKVVMRLIEV